jgi:hypothetical protein
MEDTANQHMVSVAHSSYSSPTGLANYGLIKLSLIRNPAPRENLHARHVEAWSLGEGRSIPLLYSLPLAPSSFVNEVEHIFQKKMK